MECVQSALDFLGSCPSAWGLMKNKEANSVILLCTWMEITLSNLRNHFTNVCKTCNKPIPILQVVVHMKLSVVHYYIKIGIIIELYV